MMGFNTCSLTRYKVLATQCLGQFLLLMSYWKPVAVDILVLIVETAMSGAEPRV